MTRLIFTCIVLLIALGGVQYAIWSPGSNAPVPTAEERHEVIPAQHQHETIYRLEKGNDGKLYWVKIEKHAEV